MASIDLLLCMALSTNHAWCLVVLFLIQLKQYNGYNNDDATGDLGNFHDFVEKNIRYDAGGNGFEGCCNAGAGRADQADTFQI